MASDRQEIRWVLRAQSGDRQALDDLFKSVQSPLYRYILSLTDDSVLSEDILQDVFVLIYRKLRWLKQPEYFRAWAYRITSRETFRVLRKKRQERDLNEDEMPSPSSQEMDVDLREHLKHLIGHVSPASRAALILHYLHEMSLQEVADVLELSVGTVKSRIAYGLATLRKQMQETEYGMQDR